MSSCCFNSSSKAAFTSHVSFLFVLATDRMLLEKRMLLAAGGLIVEGALLGEAVLFVGALLPGTVLLVERMLLPRIAVLICCPLSPLSRLAWSNVGLQRWALSH